MMRKSITFRVTVLSIVVILAAALGAGATGKDEVTSTAGMPELSLRVLMPGDTPTAYDLVFEEVNKRIKSELHATVKFEWIAWGDYANKINVLAASGDPYDANFDADWLTFYPNAQKGAYMDIGKLLPKYAPDIYKKLTPSKLSQLTVKGQVVAVPFRMPKNDRFLIVLREDLRKKYNLPEPKSLADMQVYWKAILDNEKGMTPFVHGALSAWAYVFAPAYGYFTLDSSPLELVYAKNDATMKLVPWEQTDAFRKAMTFMNGMYVAGFVPKDTIVSSAQNDVGTVLAAGKAASAIHIFDMAANLTSQVKAAHPDWIFKPYNFYDSDAPNVVAVNQAVCLNANGKNPERTLMFFNWVAKNQANYDLLLYGVEGKTYRLVDGAIDSIKDSSGRSTYVDWAGNWAFQDFDYHRYTVDYPKDYRKAYLAAETYKSVDTPSSGFVLNTDPIKTEYAKRLSIYREMGMAIGQGVLGPDKYDEYVQRQKDAGLDKLLAEAQKQLDAWRAAKK